MEGRPRDDDELVARARRGDDNAYEELVLRYQGIAFRTACLVTGNAADAEEVRAWLTECMVAGMGELLTEVPVVVEATIARDWSGSPA